LAALASADAESSEINKKSTISSLVLAFLYSVENSPFLKYLTVCFFS